MTLKKLSQLWLIVAAVLLCLIGLLPKEAQAKDDPIDTEQLLFNKPLLITATIPASDTASLIMRLQQASTLTEDSTITLASNSRYVLTQTDNSYNGAGNNGLPAIVTPHTITILGQGATIERGGDAPFRFFHVGLGATLILENVTLLNGSAGGSGVAGQGGAIFNRGTVTLRKRTVISNNWAMVDGGGIYNNGGTVTIRQSQLEQNQARGDGGGANNLNGVMIVAGSQLISNTAHDKLTPGIGGGGGLRNEGTAVMSVTNSLIKDNLSLDNGGGIRNDRGMLFIGNSQIINNRSQTIVGAGGGGIFNKYGQGLIDSSTVMSNSAANTGGGISNVGLMTLQNKSRVEYNSAQGHGGGISNETDAMGGVLTLTNSVVGHNQSQKDGGGIWTATGKGNQVALLGVNIRDNTAQNGGGIYNNQTMNIGNSFIFNNAVITDGGGIFSSGQMTVTNSHLAQNTAQDDGGAIHAERGFVKINNSVIAQNVAQNDGGALHSDTEATFKLLGVVVAQNKANDNGGGIYHVGGLSSIQGGNISNNSVITGNGGGIYHGNNLLTLTSTVIAGNDALAGHGGGIFKLNHNLMATNSTLRNNEVGLAGGGIYQGNGNLTLNQMAIISNVAQEGAGGGIFKLNDGLTMTNSTMSYNQAGSNGGGISQESGTAALNHVTLVHNQAGGNGGGIYRANAGMGLRNTIVALNSDTSQLPSLHPDVSGPIQDGGHNFIGRMDGGTLPFGSTTLFGAVGDELDPRLGPLGNYGGNTLTHALLTTSLAIDAGTITSDTPSYDQRGEGYLRVLGSTADIGAFEAQKPDLPVVQFTQTAPYQIREDGTIVTALALSRTGTGTATVSIGVIGGTASAEDYTATVYPLSVTLPESLSTTQLAIAINDDNIDEGDFETLIFVITPTLNAILGKVSTATLQILDNDKAGITVNAASNLQTTEAGGTAVFNIKLNSQPTAPVLIELTSSDLSEGNVTVSNATIQPHAWSSPHVVTLAGVDDTLLDGNIPYQIRLGPVTSDDPFYHGIALSTTVVQVTNLDDEISNQPPTAVNDTAQTDEDTAVLVNVLNNDHDSDGTLNSATLTIVSQPTSGTATLSGNNLIYTPHAGFTGTDSFTYRVADDDGAFSNLATVTITVNPVNKPPKLETAIPNQTTLEDELFEWGLPATTFSDPDGDTLSYTVTLTDGSPLSNSGWLTFDPSTQKLSGTPANEHVGQLFLRVTVTDPEGLVATTDFMVTVLNVNDPPVAQNDFVTTAEGIAVTIPVLSNDTDVDVGDVITLMAVSTPTNGTATIINDTILYRPAPTFMGIVTFSYTLADLDGAIDTAVVTVIINHGVELSLPDTATTAEDQAVTVNVLTNDINPDTLTVLAVSKPVHGTAIWNGSAVLYTPKPDFYGTDTFVYVVTNGQAADLALVTITVQPVNDLLTAIDDTVITLQATPISVQVLSNDSDPDGDALTVQTVTTPTHGTAIVQANKVIYTPNLDFIGQDSVVYTVTDGQGVATATVRINVVAKKPPVANSDIALVRPGQTVTIPVLLNDYDPNGGSLSLLRVGTPHQGVITLSDSVIIYTAHAQAKGTDWFDYAVSNGTRLNLGLVRVDIVPKPPLTQPLTTTFGLTLTIPITLNHSTGGQLAVTIMQPPAQGRIKISGTNLIYLPPPGLVGRAVFTYTVSDGRITETVKAIILLKGDTTPPTMPILLTPTQEVTVKRPRPFFDWTDALDRTTPLTYTLLVTGMREGQISTFKMTTAASHYTPTTDLPNGVYRWTVIVEDGAGNRSQPPEPERFVIHLKGANAYYLPVLQR